MQQENKEEEKKKNAHIQPERRKRKIKKKFCIHTMKNTVEKKRRKENKIKNIFIFYPSTQTPKLHPTQP